MKIGKYNIQVVETGNFYLDGGAMFGVIPKALWEKSNPSDEKNRVKLAARCLLLSNEKKHVLIDTGCGDKWDEKAESIYSFDYKFNDLEKSLFNLNISPAEITDVILTHLHFDHAGGSTKIDNGKIIPTFPNAVYYVQKSNFDWANNPTEKDRASFIKENYVPLFDNGMLKFINGNEQFDDEIEILKMDGHTFGQQLIKIYDSSNILFYSGDLFPYTAHVHVPSLPGFDLQPLITLKEKKNILQQSIEEDWELFFEHDPETISSKVQFTEKGFRARKIESK
jgi:glyoxylase-like metal-dependent hydrolase (beta-lactamase superfamily II)